MSPETDNAAVDAVLERLETLDDVELPERLAVFTEMQSALAAVLDEETATPPGG